MPQLRTVRCTVEITGAPEWVEGTLQRSWVIPDKGNQITAFGKVSATPGTDETREVSEDDYNVAVGRK